MEFRNWNTKIEIINATWRLELQNIFVEESYPRDVINQKIILKKYFKDAKEKSSTEKCFGTK